MQSFYISKITWFVMDLLECTPCSFSLTKHRNLGNSIHWILKCTRQMYGWMHIVYTSPEWQSIRWVKWLFTKAINGNRDPLNSIIQQWFAGRVIWSWKTFSEGLQCFLVYAIFSGLVHSVSKETELFFMDCSWGPGSGSSGSWYEKNGARIWDTE